MPVTVQPLATTQSNQSDDVVLSVKGVSKKFCRSLKRSLWYGIQDLTGELLGSDHERDTLRDGEFWALKDISFELRRGEALGLVGANGAGKTTLLRIISGLIKPDQGEIEINGRIAPLIALGAGFNPILTGRENIYANMSILGLTRQEIDDRFEDVVAFAEIGEALDTPVQSYSSGMAARLGFACAIHTEPDILLIDEVLAVGDTKFRSKCQNRLNYLRKQRQQSLIMVSHNSHSVSMVCQSALYLIKGTQIMTGDVLSVLHKYEQDLFFQGTQPQLGIWKLPECSNSANSRLKIIAIFFCNSQRQVSNMPVSGENITLCIICEVNEDLENVGVILNCQKLSENEQLVYINTWDKNIQIDLQRGKWEIQINMPYLVLGVGTYTMSIGIRQNKLHRLDIVRSFKFSVARSKQSSSSQFYQNYNSNYIRL